MLTIKRTTSDNEDFNSLVALLDSYLAVLDGEDHGFYAQYNKSSLLKNALVCYEDEKPVGIGAYKEFEPQLAEMKRMYTLPEYRGRGIAGKILSELENWAKSEGYTASILETGHLQHDAIGLYKKMGYEIIENFGQYAGVVNSVCMAKDLQ
ncbi:MAG: GNAT family N-acetyltransferase [Flavobacterium sp.]